MDLFGFREKNYLIACLGVLFTLYSHSADVAIDEPEGELLYDKYCAACHTGTDNESGPQLTSLRMMSRTQVQFALTQGKMREQAAMLES